MLEKKILSFPTAFLSENFKEHEPDQRGIPAISFCWGELRRGDCHEINGVLTLWADGRGDWKCRTWTDHTHSGDEWDCWFAFKDSRGFFIGVTDDPHSAPISVGVFKSPRMSDGGPRYDWGAQFVFPGNRFEALRHAKECLQWATA
jgi:hypothetical protein